MVALARIALALALVFAGTGASAVAAQASMPDDPLYPVKLALEDARIALTTDPSSEYEILLEMVGERFDEIEYLSQTQAPLTDQVMTRLETQLQLALMNAARMGDENLQQAMLALHMMIQERVQRMEQVRLQASPQGEHALQNLAQVMAQLRVTAEGALEDPTTFRLQHGANRPELAPDQPDIHPPVDPPSGEGETPGNPDPACQGPGGADDCPVTPGAGSGGPRDPKRHGGAGE